MIMRKTFNVFGGDTTTESFFYLDHRNSVKIRRSMASLNHDKAKKNQPTENHSITMIMTDL